MKTKYGYLKFIRWEGDEAIFKEAELVDIILGSPLIVTLKLLIKEEPVILIKSKYLPNKNENNKKIN